MILQLRAIKVIRWIKFSKNTSLNESGNEKKNLVTLFKRQTVPMRNKKIKN